MSEQAAAPAISADVELLHKMITSLENPKFDWGKIGASMGLVPATASKRYSRLKERLIKNGFDAPATPSAGPSPTKRRKVAADGNGATTPTKPKAKRGEGAKKKVMSTEHVDDEDELLGENVGAGKGNLKREFDENEVFEDFEERYDA